MFQTSTAAEATTSLAPLEWGHDTKGAPRTKRRDRSSRDISADSQHLAPAARSGLEPWTHRQGDIIIERPRLIFNSKGKGAASIYFTVLANLGSETEVLVSVWCALARKAQLCSWQWQLSTGVQYKQLEYIAIPPENGATQMQASAVRLSNGLTDATVRTRNLLITLQGLPPLPKDVRCIPLDLHFKRAGLMTIDIPAGVA